MISVQRIWAWSFDQAHDAEVKQYLLQHYIRDLHYHDPVSADELSLYITLYEPKQVTFGNQLTIPIDHEVKETRI
jgi:hypothetical protein